MEYFLQYARYRFQSTHPRRVWLLSSSLKSATKNVSIHTPTQGVTHLRLPQRLIPMFQSTHPRRVWQKWNALLLKVRLFQSTHPRRVWHRGWHEQIPMLCFNPHTHAGCDRMEILENVLSIVSIHTPTQGVTRTICYLNTWSMFQSTHPRRVWQDYSGLLGFPHKFQSTHPRRVWHGKVLFTQAESGFNPHTHAGCDHVDYDGETPLGLFQSTHPRRVWLKGAGISTLTASFNPHTHAGCDSCKISHIRHRQVSIHTPTQGVTNRLQTALDYVQFQSTHPRRVWPSLPWLS